MEVLDIRDVSQASGLPPSTLRYYEEKGLIESFGRHGLRRQYEPVVLTRLALIALGRSAGFTLEEISGMFDRDGQPQLPREAFLERADKIDRQIRELKALRDSLRHVAHCPAPSHMECPSFQRLLKVAAKKNPGRKK